MLVIKITKGGIIMKKTKEIEKEDIIDNILKFTSPEDAEEFRKIASGRKFCKKGERIQDICDEELERYEYENFSGIFTKLFKHRKFKKNKQKLMLENRVSSVIRAIVVDYINNWQEKNNEEIINKNELVLKVKNTILEKVAEYQKEKKAS